MKLLVLHGPNLNMLGLRNAEHYGTLTYCDLINIIKKETNVAFEQVDFFQSNSEGKLIDEIQRVTLENFDAILLNPGAYAHTSYAIHDALEIFKGIKVEVHLSDVAHREQFRKKLVTGDACDKIYSGKKEQSYQEAIEWIKQRVSFRKI